MLKGVYPNVFNVPKDKRITITSPRQWDYHCYDAVVFNVGDQIWLEAIPGQNGGQDPIYETIKGIVKHL